jgi:hypothetical protein
MHQFSSPFRSRYWLPRTTKSPKIPLRMLWTTSAFLTICPPSIHSEGMGHIASGRFAQCLVFRYSQNMAASERYRNLGPTKEAVLSVIERACF